jgi:cation:H+ antiporter
MASIVYLQLTLRAWRLTPGRLLVPAVFYALFALGLVVVG